MASKFEPGVIQEALLSPRWAAQVRLDASPVEVAQWDAKLVRDPRVLVPIDVQALYVPAGDATAFVRLPFSLTTPDGAAEEPMPPPFDAGGPRPPGVHLHWMPPDSLLRGEMSDGGDGARNRLGLPPLPDRWVVLRIVAPRAASTVSTRGWVIEADTAKVVPLEQWPSGSAMATAEGKTVPKQELTGTVGGSLNWIASYDAVRNRCAFHDPVTDLPEGLIGDLAAYLVAGWWSDATLDPLDRADTVSSLDVRLHELGHRLIGDAEKLTQDRQAAASTAGKRESLGLSSGRRFGTTAGAVPFTPAVSQFAEGASTVMTAPPPHPRQSLLHGVVYGVPVRGPIVADQRPRASDVDLALGSHGDDLAAVLASAGLATATASERRELERLVAAFTGQILKTLGTPDGVVAVDEHEHQASFSSRTGGPGPLERLRTGGEAGPFNAGRAARGEQARVRDAGQAQSGRPPVTDEDRAARPRDGHARRTAPGGEPDEGRTADSQRADRGARGPSAGASLLRAPRADAGAPQRPPEPPPAGQQTVLAGRQAAGAPRLAGRDDGHGARRWP